MPDRCRECEHWKRTGPAYKVDTGYGGYRLDMLGYCKVHGDKGFGEHVLRVGRWRACELFEEVNQPKEAENG